MNYTEPILMKLNIGVVKDSYKRFQVAKDRWHCLDKISLKLIARPCN